jgi:hypothetical protein
MPLIWPAGKAEYFCAPIWTTQIALKWLVKFAVARSALATIERATAQSVLAVLPVRQRGTHLRRPDRRPAPTLARLVAPTGVI